MKARTSPMTYRLIADEFEINVYYLNLTESQVKFFDFLNGIHHIFWENDVYKLEPWANKNQKYEDLTFDYNYNCSKVILTDRFWNPHFLMLDDFQLTFYIWLVSNCLIDNDVKIAKVRKEIEFIKLI